MKIKEVTPQAFICSCGACPSVFETDRETYLIIGLKVESALNSLSGRIGPNEAAIEVPVNLIKGIKGGVNE